MTGRFITLEGIEGAGKSTAVAVVSKLLQAAGLPLLTTREPGGTDLGEDVRRLLLGHKHQSMSDDTELLLMFAARAEHLQQKIIPALRQGQWVLCDRFTDATYAYQGGGRGVPDQRIALLEQWVQADLRPDLTLLLDLPVETGLQRAARRSAPDRIESQHNSFFQRVRNAYLQRAHKEPGRIKLIDAAASESQVAEQLTQVLSDFLRQVQA